MSNQILFIGFVVCCLTCFLNTLQAQEVTDEAPVEATEGGLVEVTEGVPVEVTEGVPVEVTEGVPVGATEGVPVEVTEGVPVGATEGVPVEVTEGVPVGATDEVLVEVTDEDLEESIENEIQENPPPKRLSQKRSIYGRYDDFDKTPFKVESRLSNTILVPRKDFRDRIKDSFEKY